MIHRGKKTLLEARKKELCKNAKIIPSRDSDDRISFKQIIINKKILIRLSESPRAISLEKEIKGGTLHCPHYCPGQKDACPKQEPTGIVTNAQSNLKYSSGNSFLTKSFITLPFLSPVSLKLYLSLEFGPPEFHHEEKIFKERCFAIPMFGMSDKICSATNAFQMPVQ